MNKKSRTLLQIALLLVVAGVFTAVAVYFFSEYDEFNRENVRAFVSQFGAWAPVAYFLLFLVGSPVPLLGPVLTAAGGLLFGVWVGMLYTVVFGTLVSLLPFYIARWLGRDWVAEHIHDTRLERVYKKSRGRSGFLFILVLRLVPIIPWEVQNYVAGVSRISVTIFLPATLLGMIPGSFAYALLGSRVVEPGTWQFFAALALVAVMKGVIPLIGGIYIYTNNNHHDES